MNLAMMKSALELFLIASEEQVTPAPQGVLFDEKKKKLVQEIDELMVKAKGVVDEDWVDKVLDKC